MILGVLAWPIQKVGSRSYRYIATAAKVSGMRCIFFGPGSIDTSTGKISGYIFDRHTGHLRRAICRDIPEVVYNQVRSRSIAVSQPYKHTIDYLVKNGALMFNPRFIKKNVALHHLSNYKALKAFVPETISVRWSYKRALEMLERHECVYVKPINGSLGRGIMRITKVGSSSYSLVHRGETGQRRYGVMGPKALEHTLQRLGMNKTHVIQQGIDLVGPQGRPTDFRVLVQKDGDGQWQHTFSFAKVANKGSIVSNVAAGAKCRNADSVLYLEGLIPNPGDTKRLMQQVAINAAKCIEEKLGLFGELGVDVGIDKAGHPWILEVNSRYSSKVFPRKVALASALRPVMYAHYLATSSQVHQSDVPTQSDR